MTEFQSLGAATTVYDKNHMRLLQTKRRSKSNPNIKYSLVYIFFLY